MIALRSGKMPETHGYTLEPVLATGQKSALSTNSADLVTAYNIFLPSFLPYLCYSQMAEDWHSHSPCLIEPLIPQIARKLGGQCEPDHLLLKICFLTFDYSTKMLHHCSTCSFASS